MRYRKVRTADPAPKGTDHGSSQRNGDPCRPDAVARPNQYISGDMQAGRRRYSVAAAVESRCEQGPARWCAGGAFAVRLHDGAQGGVHLMQRVSLAPWPFLRSFPTGNLVNIADLRGQSARGGNAPTSGLHVSRQLITRMTAFYKSAGKAGNLVVAGRGSPCSGRGLAQ